MELGHARRRLQRERQEVRVCSLTARANKDTHMIVSFFENVKLSSRSAFHLRLHNSDYARNAGLLLASSNPLAIRGRSHPGRPLTSRPSLLRPLASLYFRRTSRTCHHFLVSAQQLLVELIDIPANQPSRVQGPTSTGVVDPCPEDRHHLNLRLRSRSCDQPTLGLCSGDAVRRSISAHPIPICNCRGMKDQTHQ
jgi:hypothetical protein